MTLSGTVLRTLVAVYLVVVSVIGAFLIVVGYLLTRIPGLPNGTDRVYTRFMMRALDTLLRPFDVTAARIDR